MNMWGGTGRRIPVPRATNMRTVPEQRLERVRLVTEYWHRGMVEMLATNNQAAIATHPLGCVLSALAGEKDPIEMGVDPESPEGRRLNEMKEQL